MKVSRQQLLDLLEKHDLPTSKKGKPLSNDVLLAHVQASIDEMLDEEGNTDDTLVAALSTAFDEEEEITLTGDDPTVLKKAKSMEKPSKKSKKPAKEEEKEEDDDEEEKPAKKKSKAAKDEKPAKKKSKKSEDDDDEEDKPKKKKTAKPKKESVRDKWNSSPESSAGQINQIFFANKKKAMTIDDVYTALDDENVTRSRVRDHIRRLHGDGILTKDAKDRYAEAKNKKAAEDDE